MREPIIILIKKCAAFIVRSSKTPASDIILQVPLTSFPTCYFFMEECVSPFNIAISNFGKLSEKHQQGLYF